MSKPLTHHVITRARELIDDKRHWTQSVHALFKNGHVADPHDPRAWRFGTTGAIIRAGFDLTQDIDKAQALHDAACGCLFPKDDNPVRAVEEINDSRHGHAAILSLFDAYLAAH